jgi:hypothetical protein
MTLRRLLGEGMKACSCARRDRTALRLSDRSLLPVSTAESGDIDSFQIQVLYAMHPGNRLWAANRKIAGLMKPIRVASTHSHAE